MNVVECGEEMQSWRYRSILYIFESQINSALYLFDSDGLSPIVIYLV